MRDVLAFRLLLDDRNLGFEIRRLDVGDQAPFESRMKAFLKCRDFVAADSRRK